MSIFSKTLSRMEKYHIPLIPTCYYHIFSRAVGAELLFRSRENYFYFLQKYRQYIPPVAETLCYSLLPNHFHFLIRIRPENILQQCFVEIKKEKPWKDELAPDFVMERFSNLLNAYTKAFNNLYHRKGALFIDYLRRVTVDKENQFSAAVFYIHKNPVHHGLCNTIQEWPYSSYHAVLSEQPTLLNRDELLAWFGGKEQLVKFHEQPILLKNTDYMEE